MEVNENVQEEFGNNIDKLAQAASQKVPVMEESIATPAATPDKGVAVDEVAFLDNAPADAVRKSISSVRSALTLASLGDAREISRASSSLDTLEKNFDRLLRSK